ncbi:MAG: hypothetical protein SF053_22015 [Bacteroidia bacterium]|nr:hypothetical protein [Bacteroidia bacterium]
MNRPYIWYGGYMAVVFGLAWWFALPEEDACILFRYAENLAETGRISYNPGGPRTEGATDFVYMVVLAGWRRLGGDLFLGSLILNGLAALSIFRTLQGGPRGDRPDSSMWKLVVLLLILPQTMASVKGFSALVMMATLAAVWRLYQSQRYLLMLAAALGACLLRPDALVATGPLLAGWVITSRKDPSLLRLRLTHLTLICILPGLMYVGWRATYFGEWFPLPFYVKSQVAERVLGLFDPESLRMHTFAIGFDLLPAGLLALIAGGGRILHTHRLVLIAYGLIPLIFYAVMSQAMNAGFRFQGSMYLAVWIWAWEQWQQAPSGVRGWLRGLALVLILKAGYRQITVFQSIIADTYHQNTWYLARALRPYSHLHMAVTEAGRLPYYAGWRATDIWGLNDARYARRLIQPEDLAADPPALLVLDPEDDSLLTYPSPTRPHTRRTWDHMVDNARLFARNTGTYEGWLVPFCRETTLPPGWIPPCDGRRDLYLIRTDLPETEALRKILQQHGAVRTTEW